MSASGQQRPHRSIAFPEPEWTEVKNEARLRRLDASTFVNQLWRNWKAKRWQLDLIPEKRNRE